MVNQNTGNSFQLQLMKKFTKALVIPSPSNQLQLAFSPGAAGLFII
jgi:hypothetical protein